MEHLIDVLTAVLLMLTNVTLLAYLIIPEDFGRKIAKCVKGFRKEMMSLDRVGHSDVEPTTERPEKE